MKFWAFGRCYDVKKDVEWLLVVEANEVIRVWRGKFEHLQQTLKAFAESYHWSYPNATVVGKYYRICDERKEEYPPKAGAVP